MINFRYLLIQQQPEVIFHLQTGQTFKPHRSIDPVGNYFVLDTQNPGKTELSRENVT